MTLRKLTKEESTRYLGHLSLCEIDLAGQQAIANGRVLIVGAGGLGSPVALYLAAAGVGTIGLLDADTVSLNAAGIIGEYDITVDCTDNLATRLLINDTCVMTGKKMVFGAVSRFSGQVFSHVKGSACYRCIFDPTSAGPDGELPCAVSGVMNTVVGVIGSLQATEVVKLLVGTGDALINRLLTFDAMTMTFNTFRLNQVEGCKCKLG